MRKSLQSKTIEPRDDRRSLEKLESRVMLSASIADVKSGPMADSGPELISLYRDYRSYSLGGGSAINYKSSDNNIFVSRGTVAVTVHGGGSLDSVTSVVRGFGGVTFARDSKLKTVDAFIPISSLHALAVSGGVMSVQPVLQGQTQSVGSSPNQADQAENADKVRALYGLDGTGTKVGVLSDSVDQVGSGIAGSVATGDLPASGVSVIADNSDPAGSRTDEGRAMLELIHDLAPAAQLSFATVGPSQTTMADNIRRLQANGANILVDDFRFFDEPMFEPGVIDDAIHDVTQNGAVYLSAVGNNFGAGYEAPTNFVTQNGVTDVNFASNGTIQTRLRISFPQGNQLAGAVLPFVMQWDNPYNGVTGNATTDLDVYFYDPHFPNRVLFVANANNLKTGIPQEFLGIQARTMDIEIRVADHVAGKPLPTRFKFVIDDDGLTSLTTSFPQNQNDVYGHNSGLYGIGVGAVPFSNVPPFATAGSEIDSEDFSSVGPQTLIFDAKGNRLATPLVLQKPDISGVDDVDTSFFGSRSTDSDSLPNFSGTSAAAPDVAGVVALIKQADPSATQAEILSALKATARPLNGSPIGQWDPKGGFGLIDAQAAVAEFIHNPTAQIIPVSPNPTDGPVNQIKIVFSQQVSGFNIADLILSVDGGPNLLTGGNAPTTTDGGRTWFINNLSSTTDVPGLYTLELTNADGAIVDNVALPFLGDITSQFTNIGPQAKPAPPTNLVTKTLSDTAIRLRWSDNSTNEDGFLIQRATDPAFTTGVRNIRVGHNIATFTDVSLASGTTYYYRVRAFNNFSGSSTYSNIVNATTLSPGEIILDNASSSGVKIVGNWETSTATPGFFGDDYLDDLNAAKGHDSVTFTPNITAAGDYFVYARWTSGLDRATNVPITVNGKTVTVNERDTGGSGYVLLGKFSFVKGTKNSVVISNAGTNGLVVADAVEFLPADAGMI